MSFQFFSCSINVPVMSFNFLSFFYVLVILAAMPQSLFKNQQMQVELSLAKSGSPFHVLSFLHELFRP